MPSGYTATTKNHIAKGAGVLEIDGVKLVTRGGRFNPGQALRDVEFDGRAAPIAGLTYPVGYDSAIETTLIEFSADVLALVNPGSTTVVAGGTTTITPPAAYTMVAAADLPAVTWTFTRTDGKRMRVNFPKAWITASAIESADRAEGTMPVSIAARLDMDAVGATTDSPPFTYQILD